MGFNLKPKEPLSPFFRFMGDVQLSVAAQHPHLKRPEQCRVIGKMWKSLDASEKEKYLKGYKDDLLKYSVEIVNFNETFTEDKKIKLEKKLEEMRMRINIKLYQKKARELGKPKRPINAFFKYFHSQTDRQPEEGYKDYVKRVASRWRALSEAKRKKYKTTAEEIENYR